MAVVTAVMLIAMASMVIGGSLLVALTTNTAQAQSKKLTCDTTKDCNIIIRRLRVGDDLIIQFKASPIAGGGGGGTSPPASTVDQQARDDITDLKSADAVQDNNIQRLEQTDNQMQTEIATLQAENAALKQNLTLVNEALVLQTTAIQELQKTVTNITNANPFVNITIPNGNENQSGQGEQPTLPPQGNETTGTGENNTTTTPPANNESSTNPPGNETTTTPPSGNESNTTPPVITHPIQCSESEFYNVTAAQCQTVGQTNPGPQPEPPIVIDNSTGQPISNVTIPVQNQTQPGEGNITLPIEGNITLPEQGGGESNVTLPIDNSSGNIIVENGTGGTVLENGTLANSTNGTISGDIVGFRANQ